MTRDDAELERLARELYPTDDYLQRQWLRGVELVRTTARGWCLDPPVFTHGVKAESHNVRAQENRDV